MIGSNHDNRLKIAKIIASQLRAHGMNYCFKRLDKSLKENDIVIHKPLSTDSVQKVMMQSDCILDTDRESQSGTTPRLIWALAMGKKVITTNQNIKQMPFYNAELIHIIDRNNPVVDMDFIESQPDFSRCQKLIQTLRIDAWVKNFCV